MVLEEMDLKDTSPELPFLFLTSKSLKIDVLKGFATGAVDYLKKPIDEEELVVRIRALLSYLSQKEGPGPALPTYPIGQYILDTKNQELRYGGETIGLTEKEYGLLVYLYRHRNQLCTYKEILTTIWDKTTISTKRASAYSYRVCGTILTMTRKSASRTSIVGVSFSE